MEQNWFVQPTILVVVDEWDGGPMGFHSGLGVFGPYTREEAQAVAAGLKALATSNKWRPFSDIEVFQVAPQTVEAIWHHIAGREEAHGTTNNFIEEESFESSLEFELEAEEPFGEKVISKINRWSRRHRWTRKRRFVADFS
jgi:hypothetical protein